MNSRIIIAILPDRHYFLYTYHDKNFIFTQDGSEGLRGLIIGLKYADESDEDIQLFKTASDRRKETFAAAFMEHDYTVKTTTLLSTLSNVLTPSKSRGRAAFVSFPFYAG